MRWSLLILDVMFVIELYSTVSQLSIVDFVTSVTHSSRASPMPVHPPDELEPCNLLIGQVCDDLKHFATISIDAKNLKIHQARSIETILQGQGAKSYASQ